MNREKFLIFIEARLREGREDAGKCQGPQWTAAPFVYGPPGEGWGPPEDGPWEIGIMGRSHNGEIVSHQPHEGGGVNKAADALHIAAYDPQWALDFVTGMETILAECRERIQLWENSLVPGLRSQHARAIGPLLFSLRCIATVWNRHPEYDPSYRPES